MDIDIFWLMYHITIYGKNHFILWSLARLGGREIKISTDKCIIWENLRIFLTYLILHNFTIYILKGGLGIYIHNNWQILQKSWHFF